VPTALEESKLKDKMLFVLHQKKSYSSNAYISVLYGSDNVMLYLIIFVDFVHCLKIHKQSHDLSEAGSISTK
jgi:hypothetical protein